MSAMPGGFVKKLIFHFPFVIFHFSFSEPLKDQQMENEKRQTENEKCSVFAASEGERVRFLQD
jgi:hypothetical protein